MFCYNCGNRVGEVTTCPFCNKLLSPLNKGLEEKALKFLESKKMPDPSNTLPIVLQKSEKNTPEVKSPEELLNIYSNEELNIFPEENDLSDLTEKLSTSNSAETLIKLAVLKIKALIRQNANACDDTKVIMPRIFWEKFIFTVATFPNT